MQLQYCKTAWRDISNSDGWFGKICLLTVLNFIPIFGQIVSGAYGFGWAREIAWNIHQPMPNVFANEDGKFWRRGWFTLVLTFIGITVLNLVMTYVLPQWPGLWIVICALAILINFFIWIGSMRIALYDSFSAGFQLKKIWKMLAYDAGGMAKILGMELLLSCLLGCALIVLSVIAFGIVIVAGLASLSAGGYPLDPGQLSNLWNIQPVSVLGQFAVGAGLLVIFLILIFTFFLMLISTFVELMVQRALGYWTSQFDVEHWGGQDDPLPFEQTQLTYTVEVVNTPTSTPSPTNEASVGSTADKPSASQQSLTPQEEPAPRKESASQKESSAAKKPAAPKKPSTSTKSNASSKAKKSESKKTQSSAQSDKKKAAPKKAKDSKQDDSAQKPKKK